MFRMRIVVGLCIGLTGLLYIGESMEAKKKKKSRRRKGEKYTIVVRGTEQSGKSTMIQRLCGDGNNLKATYKQIPCDLTFLESP